MPALVAVAPLVKLLHARLEHLVRVKTGVLSQQRLRECLDQCLGRVTQGEIAGDQAARSTNLLLAVKRIEQGSAELLGGDRQIIETVPAFAGQLSRWHIQVPSEIKRHG